MNVKNTEGASVSGSIGAKRIHGGLLWLGRKITTFIGIITIVAAAAILKTADRCPNIWTSKRRRSLASRTPTGALDDLSVAPPAIDRVQTMNGNFPGHGCQCTGGIFEERLRNKQRMIVNHVRTP